MAHISRCSLKKPHNSLGIPSCICFNYHVIICKSDAVGCVVYSHLYTGYCCSAVSDREVPCFSRRKVQMDWLSRAKLLWWPHGHHESSLGQCGWWRNNPNRKRSSLEEIHRKSSSSAAQCRERRWCSVPFELMQLSGL